MSSAKSQSVWHTSLILHPMLHFVFDAPSSAKVVQCSVAKCSHGSSSRTGMTCHIVFCRLEAGYGYLWGPNGLYYSRPGIQAVQQEPHNQLTLLHSCKFSKQMYIVMQLSYVVWWLAGLRQAMATFGALMGSIIAGLAYKLSNRNYTVTFSLSAVPALAALLLVTTVSFLHPCHFMYAISMLALPLAGFCVSSACFGCTAACHHSKLSHCPQPFDNSHVPAH